MGVVCPDRAMTVGSRLPLGWGHAKVHRGSRTRVPAKTSRATVWIRRAMRGAASSALLLRVTRPTERKVRGRSRETTATSRSGVPECPHAGIPVPGSAGDLSTGLYPPLAVAGFKAGKKEDGAPLQGAPRSFGPVPFDAVLRWPRVAGCAAKALRGSYPVVSAMAFRGMARSL